MSESSSKAAGAVTRLYDTTNNWNRERAIIYSGDIRTPWKSAYGFPMTAAQLAAGDELVLTCRPDEVFDYLRQLNALLGSPESLNRAYDLLEKLNQATQQKFTRLLQLQDQPLSTSESPELIAEVEEILTGAEEQTVADRLADRLAPDDPTRELVGLGKMLSRLQRRMVALAEVKDRGFKVVVTGQRRQPKRPGLEARRNEPVGNEQNPNQLRADFLPPPVYHLTLWAYIVVRSDGGQSAVWN